MVTSISASSQTLPTQNQGALAEAKPATTKAQQVPSDTVTISSAAKAAAQELSETHVQTAQEAAHGDVQAKRLLAKESATQAPPVKSKQ
jgi:hypothetical protein